jgi:hypothetical protein
MRVERHDRRGNFRRYSSSEMKLERRILPPALPEIFRICQQILLLQNAELPNYCVFYRHA